jgi:hypothetical protein
MGVPTKLADFFNILLDRGDRSSAGRALFNLFMDVITLLIWEIPATAAEASRGEQRRYPVGYDPEEKLWRSMSMATCNAFQTGIGPHRRLRRCRQPLDVAR